MSRELDKAERLNAKRMTKPRDNYNAKRHQQRQKTLKMPRDNDNAKRLTMTGGTDNDKRH